MLNGLSTLLEAALKLNSTDVAADILGDMLILMRGAAYYLERPYPAGLAEDQLTRRTQFTEAKESLKMLQNMSQSMKAGRNSTALWKQYQRRIRLWQRFDSDADDFLIVVRRERNRMIQSLGKAEAAIVSEAAEKLTALLQPFHECEPSLGVVVQIKSETNAAQSMMALAKQGKFIEAVTARHRSMRLQMGSETFGSSMLIEFSGEAPPAKRAEWAAALTYLEHAILLLQSSNDEKSCSAAILETLTRLQKLAADPACAKVKDVLLSTIEQIQIAEEYLKEGNHQSAVAALRNNLYITHRQ
jgi:hypothetical protein